MAVTKKATKRSYHAGKVAPPLTAKGQLGLTDPIKIKIEVDANDVAKLDMAALRLGEAAKFVASRNDPRVKQLHRRVVAFVYDSAGVRISSGQWDIAADDRLNIGVTKDSIVASTINGAR
jgi:hypothetical protein